MRISDWSSDVCSSDLLPACVTPEAQAAQAEAWTAGTAYAALLHDIGKIAVDLHVEHADGSVWHPRHGPLRKPYRFRYRKEREYRLHRHPPGRLYARLPDPATIYAECRVGTACVRKFGVRGRLV